MGSLVFANPIAKDVQLGREPRLDSGALTKPPNSPCGFRRLRRDNRNTTETQVAGAAHGRTSRTREWLLSCLQGRVWKTAAIAGNAGRSGSFPFLNPSGGSQTRNVERIAGNAGTHNLDRPVRLLGGFALERNVRRLFFYFP